MNKPKANKRSEKIKRKIKLELRNNNHSLFKSKVKIFLLLHSLTKKKKSCSYQL